MPTEGLQGGLEGKAQPAAAAAEGLSDANWGTALAAPQSRRACIRAAISTERYSCSCACIPCAEFPLERLSPRVGFLLLHPGGASWRNRRDRLGRGGDNGEPHRKQNDARECARASCDVRHRCVSSTSTQDHLEREETVARFIRSRCGGCHTLRVRVPTLHRGRDQRGADCFFLGRLMVRLMSGPGRARSASA